MLKASRHNRRSGLRPGSAFTLVELLVVLAVIAILVGAMAPEMSGTYQTMQLRAAARRMGDMIAFCSSSSGAEQRNYRLCVDPELGRAWVELEYVDEETGETMYESSQFPGMQSYRLPETVIFDPEDVESYLNPDEEGLYYIQFRRDGISDFSALTLVPRLGNPMQVTVNGLTGRVKIVEIMPEAEEGTEETTE